MSISDDLSLLTQGAVFLNKKGRTAKLLFVTNTFLPASVQVSHPPQVVYANEEGDICSRDVDAFLKVYKFFNVDPDLETRLENLFVFNENDPAFESADEELTNAFAAESVSSPLKTATPVKATKAATEIVAQMLKATTLQDEEDSLLLPPQYVEVSRATTTPHLTVAFSTYGNAVAIGSKLEKLSKSVIAYAQEPDLTQSLIVHRLTFALDKELTIPVLQELFRPRDEESDPRNIVDLFEVRTAESADATAWTSYLGVFPEYTKHGLYATVLVGTDEFRETPADELQVQVDSLSELYNKGTKTSTYSPENQTIILPEVTLTELNEVVMSKELEAVSNKDGQGFSTQTNPDNLLSQNHEQQRTMTHLEIPGNISSEQAQQFVTAFQTTGIQINPPLAQLFPQSSSNDIPGAL